VSNTELRRGEVRRSGQSEGQPSKEGGKGKGGGQTDEKAARGVGHEGGHFQQLEAQRIELCPAQARGERGHLRAQRVQEQVGGGVFQQAKEVGGQGVAGEPIGLERVFEVLDEILTLPPLTIGVIEERGGKLCQRGHDKAGSLALRGNFRFHDHVACLRPTLRGIGKRVKVWDGLPGRAKAGPGFGYSRCPLTQEDGILCQAQHLGEPTQFLV
jgi:hypothetical protein